MKGILSGIRVLDFGRHIAGPYCGALLADLGADVIRIEAVRGGDDRFGQYPMDDAGTSASFLTLNRNKRGMTLNPMKPEAADVIKRLAQTADVVSANLPADAMERMGIGYAKLKEINPRIIVTRVSAFGDSGPWMDRVGLDGIAQAMSGSGYLTGRPGEPAKCFAPWVDVLAGLLAAFGTVSAIRHRDQTGEGQEVGTDLLTAGIAGLSWIHTEQAGTDANRVADGSKTQSSAPGDFYQTRDGWIVSQIIGAPLFKRWSELMGEDHWLSDPRFQNDTTRAENRAVLCERTQQWAGSLSTDEAVEALAKSRIPAGPILSPQQTLDHPQVKSREIFQPVDYPGLKAPAMLARHPLDYSKTPATVRQRPPTLGEHTDEILTSIGFSTDQIAGLRRSGTI